MPIDDGAESPFVNFDLTGWGSSVLPNLSPQLDER
jgi:hypothetical protein